MTIGILAVQLAFIEHERMLESLGVSCRQLRQKSDLSGLDGVVLPGGESTVQNKLLRELDMLDPLRDMIKGGLPVLATCAGLILLAEHISNDPAVCLGTMPVTVRRNAYGRQTGSFMKEAPFEGVGDVNMIFIRAPYIEEAGKGVQVLARVDGRISAARFGSQLGISFHPELGGDTRIHQYFLQMVKGRKQN